FQFEIVSAHGVHCIGTQTGGFYRLSDKKITSVPQVFQDILATK
ncbi:acyl-CoA thioesterase, partial [Staphylococcus aureus]|nr:acyl-CoA thioesterase [Staphylococcus aureus]